MKRVYDKGHDDYRKVCCFFCLRKGEGKKTDAPLSARETELIVSHFFPNFEMEKDFLPLGCCGSCRANLSYRFGKTQRLERYKPFPCESDNSFYQDIIDSIRKLPRGSGGNKNCQCFICEPAHKDFTTMKVRAGLPKPEFSNEVSRDNRSLDQSRLSEVTDLMGKLTPKTKDMLVVARIKEKQVVESKTHEDPISFTGAAGGTPVQVITGTKAKKKLMYDDKPPVPRSTFENMASSTDLSNQKAKTIAREFRLSQGKTSIEAGFAEGLAAGPKVLKKYFTTKYIDLEIKKENLVVKERKKLVYCHDLSGFANYVKEDRGITEDIEVDQKIGKSKF